MPSGLKQMVIWHISLLQPTCTASASCLDMKKPYNVKKVRLTLDDRYCWVDVWAFTNTLDRADVQWKEERIKDAIQLMEKAIEIYKGPFLAQETEKTWKISLSELLRSKFLRSIEKLGQYWQEIDQWKRL